MNLIKLQGSYYEMGLQYGKMVKDRLKIPRPDENQNQWIFGCKEYLKKYTPDILEELRGVADAADLDHTFQGGDALLEVEELIVRGPRFFHGDCSLAGGSVWLPVSRDSVLQACRSVKGHLVLFPFTTEARRARRRDGRERCELSPGLMT